jgi:hypothetical protein
MHPGCRHTTPHFFSSASFNPAVDNHKVPAIESVISHDGAYILLKRQVDMQYLCSDEL